MGSFLANPKPPEERKSADNTDNQRTKKHKLDWQEPLQRNRGLNANSGAVDLKIDKLEADPYKLQKGAHWKFPFFQVQSWTNWR